MWKPNDVLPQHKWRARVVWVGLLLSIVAYTIWQIVTIVLERANPSTSLAITDDRYDFPFVLVCVFDDQGQGCSEGSKDLCIATALEYSSVTFNGESTTDPVVQSQADNCVGFDLPILDVNEIEADIPPFADINMVWLASTDASADTSYIESVGVYITEEDPDVGSYYFINVPYNRNSVDSLDFELSITEMTIGKITQKFLSGETVTTFPTLSISTSSSKNTNENLLSSSGSAGDFVTGSLTLRIAQGSYSRSVLEDVDPLEIGTFLGNIGGFWELLILVWGLCFIAIRQDRNPTMKARNFAKSIQIGKEIVTRRRSLSTPAPTMSVPEERPQWDSTKGGNGAHTNTGPIGGSIAQTSNGSSNSSKNEINGVKTFGLASTNRQKRPVESSLPRRVEKAASSNTGVPSHRAALPTYNEHVNGAQNVP